MMTPWISAARNSVDPSRSSIDARCGIVFTEVPSKRNGVEL
jgi:hypothetical protein